MRISCNKEFVDKKNEDGLLVESVKVTCTRCGHSTWAYGTHDASVNRCLAELNEQCPNDESNFYEVNQ